MMNFFFSGAHNEQHHLNGCGIDLVLSVESALYKCRPILCNY